MPQPTTGRSRPTRTTATRVGPAAIGRWPRGAARPAHAHSLAWIKAAALIKLILLAALFLPNQPVGAAAPYAGEYDETAPELNHYLKEQHQRIASERQELFRKRVAIPDAVSDKVFAAYAARQKIATASIPPSAGFQELSSRNLLTAICVLLAGVIAIRKLAPEVFDFINARFNPWAQTAGMPMFSAKMPAEDEAFSEFLAVFRATNSVDAAPSVANALGGTDALDSVQPRANESEPIAVADPLVEFFANAPAQIIGLRKVFSEISRAVDDVARQNILVDFHQQVGGFKDSARIRELRPVWLVASALEGLLKQLSKNAANVTASALGTAAGAVDLLEVLAVRGVNPDLATEPPVKLLAVDDDPVSRLAISFALKKAFNAPDLAPDGPAALELIAQQPYDVVFLDVDMPGMDGYELCMKIHENDLHQTTPVVFVTRHGDFNSRAKSTLSGGQDLIAKPFLAFEITVKALTLALRGRLQKHEPQICATSQEEPAANESTGPVANDSPAAAFAETSAADTVAQNGMEAQAGSTTSPAGKAAWEFSDRGFQALFSTPRNDSPDAFLVYAPTCLELLRDKLQAAQQATGPTDLQKILGQLYLAVRSFHEEAERAELRTVTRLSSALEGMLKKMLERTKLCTPSTFSASAAALELLEELCLHADTPLDLANPPPNILVVDDDPVARRGISMAIQLAFGRPDDAESGEAALALAAEKSFDLIFLDVLMPGIDGFTACSKLHKTGPNRRTPVVFVTSHDDTEARSKAVTSGGCGFIPKPVLSSQIKLTALTHILRARLNHPQSAPAPETEDCLQTA
jgi:CheY-like chemotaxis protein